MSPKFNMIRHEPKEEPKGDSRLWKSIDDIFNILENIQRDLSKVGRLEERVDSFGKGLSRLGDKSDTNDRRLRELELQQAEARGDSKEYKRNRDEIDKLKLSINNIKNSSARNTGQKDVGKEILKWMVWVGGLLIMYAVGKQ